MNPKQKLTAKLGEVQTMKYTVSDKGVKVKKVEIPKATKRMLYEMQILSTKVWTAADFALHEPNEKKRDRLVNKMINLVEEMEPLYSQNWH